MAELAPHYPITNKHLKRYERIGHVFSWGLILFSLAFYQERISSWGSYQLFQFINSEFFYLEDGSPVALFGQLLPFIAMKLQLGLSYVLMAFSLGHVLYYYAFFNLFLYRYKHPGLAISVVLLQYIGLYHGHYNPDITVYYSIPWILLSYLMLGQRVDNRTQYASLAIAVLLVTTGHWIGTMLLAITLMLYYLTNGYNKEDQKAWLVAIASFAVGISYSLFLAPEAALSLNAATIPNIKILQILGKDIIGSSWLTALLGPGKFEVITLSITLISLLLLKGRGKILIPLSIILFCYTLFALLFNGYTREPLVAELIRYPISAILIIAIGTRLRSYPRVAHAALGPLMVVLLVFSIIRTAKVSDLYLADTEEHRKVSYYAKCLGSSKFRSHYDNLIHHAQIGARWNYPAQSLLISSLPGPEHSVAIQWNRYTNGRRLTNKQHLIRPQVVQQDDLLNPKYFSLGEGNYMPLQENMMVNNMETRSWQNLYWQLPITNSRASLPVNTYTTLPLKLRVRPHKPVFADIRNCIQFSYHWCKMGAEVEEVEWEGLRTSVEMDVTNTHEQSLYLKTPTKRGQYVLMVDPVSEYKDWFHQAQYYDIDVY